MSGWKGRTSTPLDQGSVRNYIRKNVAIDANGCWLWTKALNKQGYGVGIVSYKQYRTNRLAAWAWGILDDLDSPLLVCHKNDVCKSMKCCNPDHLYVGTHADNAADYSNTVTHCPEGHPYDELNTFWVPSKTVGGKPGRCCRICRLKQGSR